MFYFPFSEKPHGAAQRHSGVSTLPTHGRLSDERHATVFVAGCPRSRPPNLEH